MTAADDLRVARDELRRMLVALLTTYGNMPRPWPDQLTRAIEALIDAKIAELKG